MSDQELSKAYDPSEVETHWYRQWMEKNCFRAEATSSKPPFCIVLPPPNVTGSLHLGHALTATIEDILCRWKRMSGHNVLWQAGTDHAGIATQMVVERELKKTEGKSRHDLGREAFIARVWEWKNKYGQRIGEQHHHLGASLDWSRERFTLDEKSSAAVREVFVRLYEEQLIYRAQKLINWCPSCHTALSDLEVEHEERKGSLWHIRYPVVGSDRSLTVATTRPETMLGDTAVAVHPDDPRYEGLVGKRVVLPLVGREIPIVADAQLVNMEFGTGAVKVTPAHDFNDYETGLRHKLPMISILDADARISKDGGAYAGLDRFEARKRVLADLTEQGFLVSEEPHALSVGTCQRCGTVVEPRLSPQWFVRTEPLAKPAIEAVEKGRTVFVPESWTNTYFQWMRNIHDWCISRQLWWGHQIPAYYCKSCGPTLATGGLDYANATPVVGREPPGQCARCEGKEFEQDPDVLDTWFSSALWPFSTLGWPNQTPELKTFYPTNVMETGHDIIFFWVARMMMMGLHFMKDVPFRTVYLHAMVRDEKGEKMSKTKGNVIDPLDIIVGAKPEALAPAQRNKFPQGMPAYGADALRFTLASLTQQGRDIKLSLERVGGYRAFANKLWNASRFALMNLGDFRPDGKFVKDRELTLADRWILARLDKATGAVLEGLRAYQFAEAASAAYQFIWGELCDWYIELAKGSLYGEDAAAKQATKEVLVFCLDQVLRLLHPYMPFITEEIWHKLPIERPTEFIMLAPYPKRDERLQDAEAEAEMAPVISAIEGLRNIRGESNLSPGAKVPAFVQVADGAARRTLERWRHYLVPLASLSELTVTGPGKSPPQSAAYVGAGIEIFVPLAGLLDLGEEQKRLGKEIAKVEQDLASLEKKLSNPNFAAKAPPDVVEKDRQRVEELKGRKARLTDNLARIAPEEQMSRKPTNTNGVHQNGSGGATTPAKVPGPEGNVDLGKELRAELEGVRVSPDSKQVTESIGALKEVNKADLSASDHYDLGVAYMGMGLVDEAVREFNEAKAAPKSSKVKKKTKKAAKPKAKAPPKKKAAKRAAKAKVKTGPKKKAAKKSTKAKATKRGKKSRTK